MIRKKGSFKHSGLRELWEDPEKNPAKIPSTMLPRCKLILSHLETAKSINDIAKGLGETKNFHKLKPLNDDRYSLDVTGNFRITFKIVDDETGEVTEIDLKDTH